MMCKTIKLLLIMLPLLFVGNTNAAYLSLSPSSTFAETGDSVTLDLMVGGLGDFASDSLGDFDVDILYDSAVLSVTSFSLTNLLGDISLFEADDFSLGDDGLGLIDLAVVSYLFDFELDALQPTSFSLAEIIFSVDALAANSQTIVSIANNYILGDALGDPLAVTAADSAIIHNRTVISEPPVLWLMIPALLLMLRRRILN